MQAILNKVFGRAADLIDFQPVVALFIGGALITVFLGVILRGKPVVDDPGRSLWWTLYHKAMKVVWALALVWTIIGALCVLRVYLHQTLAKFQRTHGRVTEANYNAIQTIWGTPHEQGELRFEPYYEEEVTERIESEDLTKPAILRKRIVRQNVTDNPFISARHDVILTRSDRKKGSALYRGYETVCSFHWRLKNPLDRELSSTLTFPLPSASGIYDDLTATLNGEDVLPKMKLRDGILVLDRPLIPKEDLDMVVSFKSRGMSYWYFQVQEQREIRDFSLSLRLPDLPKERLNFPEGCMTPTEAVATADGRGTTLTFRLDHAISNKGMGVDLPSVPQPGAATNAVLTQVETAWLLLFAMLVFGLSLAGGTPSALISVLLVTACAFVYGLLGDLNDLLFGFWGTCVLVLVPAFLFLAWLLRRIAPGGTGKTLSVQLLVFGLLYPALAGLDAPRQSLYFNLAALTFLAFAAWQLRNAFRSEEAPIHEPLDVREKEGLAARR